jgi:hypothetical protein
MSVRELGSAVAKEVAVNLKPLGFRRSGALFSRDRLDFIEHFAIVGDRWNSGELPWKFHIDVGVFFSQLPALTKAKGLWRKAHAIGSTGQIAPETPLGFYVIPETVADVAAQVHQVIVKVSGILAAVAAPARDRAAKGLVSPLPVPDSWSRVSSEES